MHLHIVTLNVPYPADYGGVIDMFYRIKALHEAGVKIHLHCYTYGRPPATELNRYCVEVNYYRRQTCPSKLLTRRPYIVSSRCSIDLLQRLQQDSYPILLEGIHCCWLLEQIRLDEQQNPTHQHRLVIVRAHNVEHDYYAGLAQAERRLLHKAYLATDARKLRRYEPILSQADAILAITDADKQHFEQQLAPCPTVVTIPAAHRFDEVNCQLGTGDYAIFHGDLSVTENINAAHRLVNEVFTTGRYPLYLAGRNPHHLRHLVAQHHNIKLIANPDNTTMERLISNAQVNILITDQPTGLKLKLLHALYRGRHCLVNRNMVAGTPLAGLCYVADTADEMQSTLSQLMHRPFTSQDVQQRIAYLGQLFSNRTNATKIINILRSKYPQ